MYTYIYIPSLKEPSSTVSPLALGTLNHHIRMTGPSRFSGCFSLEGAPSMVSAAFPYLNQPKPLGS